MKLAKVLVFVMASTLVLGKTAYAVENKVPTGTSTSHAPDSIDKASATELANFKADPKSLLSSNPIGGLQLVGMAKALALADSNTVASLIDLIASANALQLAAIGSGLGQAAKQLKDSSDENDQKTAQTIQSQIDAAMSEALLNAFKNGLTGIAAPNGKTGVQTSLSGNSVGGLGGGVGGAVNTNGTSTGSQSSATTNTAPSASKSSVNTTESIPFSGTVVTCTTSVSPTHAC